MTNNTTNTNNTANNTNIHNLLWKYTPETDDTKLYLTDLDAVEDPMVFAAIENSRQVLPFVMDGAWKKHGTNSKVSSHLITTNPAEDEQLSFELALLNMARHGWLQKEDKGDIIIATIDIHQMSVYLAAVEGAIELKYLPAYQPCAVKALGAHPTLVTQGQPLPTDIITLVIEKNASDDPDLAEFPQLAGKPVLATWFPGRALPPSKPHDCAEGDSMTAGRALELGWKVAAFVDEI